MDKWHRSNRMTSSLLQALLACAAMGRVSQTPQGRWRDDEKTHADQCQPR